MNDKYTVFKRSARNFEEFARARKATIRRGLSLDEARRLCANFNNGRTAAQVARGTKYEFTAQ